MARYVNHLYDCKHSWLWACFWSRILCQFPARSRSKTLLITWSLPVSSHQTASPRMLVTYMWQDLYWSKRPFFLFSKSQASSMLEQKPESQKCGRCNDLQFKCIWREIEASSPGCSSQDSGRALSDPFWVILQACAYLFAGLATLSPYACRMLCLFLRWIPEGQCADYAIKSHFCQVAVFQYDGLVRLKSSWLGRFVYRTGNHSRALFATRNQQKADPEEEIARHLVALGKDARQATSRSPQNLVFKLTLI